MSHPVPSKSRKDVQLCNRCNHTYSLSFQIPDVASLRTGYLTTTTEGRLICGAIAETGVDVISSGALTHSVRALDLGLDVEVD